MLVNPAKSANFWDLSFLICKWDAGPDPAFNSPNCPLAQKSGISLSPFLGAGAGGGQVWLWICRAEGTGLGREVGRQACWRSGHVLSQMSAQSLFRNNPRK